MSVTRYHYTVKEAAYLANACLAWTEAPRGRKSIFISIAFDKPGSTGQRISENAVNKAIEEGVVEAKTIRLDRLRRCVSNSAIMYVVASKLIDTSLSRKKKRTFYKLLESRLRELETKASTEVALFNISKHLVVDFRDEFEPWYNLISTYGKNRDKHIERNPEIMGGLPIITGTRIPVYSVLARIDGGDSVKDIRGDYPDIPVSAIEAAVVYARAHPKPGRPKLYR